METFAEYERKLDATAEFELPEFPGTPLEPRDFVSVYYDTADLSLARSGITLRRRVERDVSTWQLKLPQADDRLELSADGDAAAPPHELARLLRAHTRHAELVPVAELRTSRRGTLVDTGRVVAEVTIDEVAVMDGRSVAHEFVEVEVEVRSGDRKGIEEIVERLERAGAHDGDRLPKLFRALDLPRLDDRDDDGDAFARLHAGLRGQLTAILAHDPGTRLGADPESLHDMRVAVRRTRALLRAGRKLVATDTHAFEDELRWIGEVLGSVRDLDVLLAHLHDEARRLDAGDADAALSLLDALERERDGAHVRLVHELDSARFLTLLDRFEGMLARLEPAEQAPSLDALVDKQLAKLRRSVDALDDDPSDADLHSQRKRGKRLRYTAELARRSTLVKRAKAFQDVLGEHQDAVVAQQKLRELAASATPDQALAAGRLIERAQRRQARARAAWPKAWEKLARAG